MSGDFMDAQTGVELTHLFSHPFADKLIMNAASLVFLKIRKEFKVISFTLLISICKIFLYIYYSHITPFHTKRRCYQITFHTYIYIYLQFFVCVHACADVFLIIIDESDDRLYR